ncbi:M28 family peptidase [bacterium]|nr:MAG: M28 family peptidase [bacterium]
MKTILLLLLITTTGFSQKLILTERADPSLLEATVRFLADTIGGRSYQQKSALKRASEYIQQKFTEFSLTPKLQTYTVNGEEYENIYAEIVGESEKAFVIGAHYDTYSDLPGADDNASGVAGLIETARLVSQSGKPSYTLVFVAFTLEEPPFFRTENMGSYRFAKMLADSGRAVIGMASIEMIGYFSDKKIQEYPSSLFKIFYPSEGNFIASVSNFGSSSLADEYQDHAQLLKEIDCAQLAAPSAVQGVDFSDHLNFWRFGIDAFMITDTAFLRNRNYHTRNDKADNLDYLRMSFVVNALANMAMGKF